MLATRVKFSGEESFDWLALPIVKLLSGCKADFAPESAPMNKATPNIKRITATPFQSFANLLACAGKLSSAL